MRLPAAEVVARIVAVGCTVAPGTQTIALRAEVRVYAERLRPGQLVEALVDAPPRNGVAGAGRALAGRRAGVFVYVERPDGFFAQPVQVQEESQAARRVAAPFNGGERIAVWGGRR